MAVVFVVKQDSLCLSQLWPAPSWRFADVQQEQPAIVLADNFGHNLGSNCKICIELPICSPYYSRRHCVECAGQKRCCSSCLVVHSERISSLTRLDNQGAAAHLRPAIILNTQKKENGINRKTQLISKNCFAFLHRNRKDNNGHKYMTDANNVLDSFKGLQTVLIVEGFTWTFKIL